MQKHYGTRSPDPRGLARLHADAVEIVREHRDLLGLRIAWPLIDCPFTVETLKRHIDKDLGARAGNALHRRPKSAMREGGADAEAPHSQRAPGDSRQRSDIRPDGSAVVRPSLTPPARCPVCGGLNPGDPSHTRCM